MIIFWSMFITKGCISTRQIYSTKIFEVMHKNVNSFIIENKFSTNRRYLSAEQNKSQQSMNIFDKNAKLLQRERAALSNDVKLFDYLKEEVGYRLADRVFDVKKKFKTAVDLGCGRGYVSKNVFNDCVDHLILCDMSPTMLSQAEGSEGLKITKKLMQKELLQFDKNSLDLVLSSMYLHWVNDLPGCFKSVLDCLKPDGVFIAALLGGDTLYELRSSLQLAELERLGGIAAHVSPFAECRDIGGLLGRAGFNMLTVDTDEIVVGYPSMFELLRDLKGMGENNSAWNRPLHLNRDVLLAASGIYQEMYGKEKGIPATFQIIYLVGWKPHHSQPKPLERGSATKSFKDLGKVSEGIIEK